MPARELVTPRGRAHRLARRALVRYPIEAPRLRLLSLKEHVLFRVVAREPGQAAPAHFALRIYGSEARGAAAVRTEVEWLAALRRDTTLGVPEPVATRGGALVLDLAAEDEAEPRRCALSRWVTGRHRKAAPTPAALEGVGRFVARRHEHAARFVPTVGHAGLRWDWARVFGPDSLLDPDGAAPLLSPDQRALFRATAARLRAAMARLGTAPDVWGLIHADLHAANRLFCGDEVRAIDFECCGWGYYLYDLAVILDEVQASYAPRAAALRPALLRGYRQVRALTAEHEALLDLFVTMRLVELARWYGSSADPAHGPAAVQLVDEAARQMRRLDLVPA